jgi:hypothetical protein
MCKGFIQKRFYSKYFYQNLSDDHQKHIHNKVFGKLYFQFFLTPNYSYLPLTGITQGKQQHDDFLFLAAFYSQTFYPLLLD